ncbi:carbohydrate ABC transporter permease [Catellatospora chokoriensis]|uniref:Sugar ABC transporter permease n=1 Tax=Catellatospora chokoriensis TaxID=310353 RepID=A0A8J3NRC5_9ACTN|nr:carbohydrate ABC transporter permease [Catellatospora chokoriensis]GIF87980.1 sugar ABC transporter permease [Catellatospora chokoriensis]
MSPSQTLTRPDRAASADHATRPGDRRRTRSASPLLGRGVVNGVLIAAMLWTVLPLTWLVVAATKGYADLYSTGGFEFARVRLWENLVALFTFNDGLFLRWLLNSFLYAGVGALVSSMISILAGYAFDKFRFPGKERWFGLVLLGVLVPAAVTTVPLYLMASDLGLTNSFWGVFLPGLASPFGVYLGRVFSQAYVPDELLEATRVDGAGELRTFWQIAFPLLRPAFATLFLFGFTGGWNAFFMPLLMLSDHELYPVGLGLFMWRQLINTDQDLYYPLLMTGSLVAILPLIVAFFSLQRYWKAGLTAGAVK